MAFPLQAFNSWLKGHFMSHVVRWTDQVTEGIRRELQEKVYNVPQSGVYISSGKKRLRMVDIEI